MRAGSQRRLCHQAGHCCGHIGINTLQAALRDGVEPTPESYSTQKVRKLERLSTNSRQTWGEGRRKEGTQASAL